MLRQTAVVKKIINFLLDFIPQTMIYYKYRLGRLNISDVADGFKGGGDSNAFAHLLRNYCHPTIRKETSMTLFIVLSLASVGVVAYVAFKKYLAKNPKDILAEIKKRHKAGK